MGRFEQQDRLIAQGLGELEDQARLAEPCVADHVDGTEIALLHHVPMLVQQRELDIAAAQTRQLNFRAPSEVTSTKPSTRSNVALEMHTEPGAAAACRREATFTVSPSAL